MRAAAPWCKTPPRYIGFTASHLWQPLESESLSVRASGFAPELMQEMQWDDRLGGSRF